MFSKKPKKLLHIWTTFNCKLDHQDPSKIAQSGHTVTEQSKFQLRNIVSLDLNVMMTRPDQHHLWSHSDLMPFCKKKKFFPFHVFNNCPIAACYSLTSSLEQCCKTFFSILKIELKSFWAFSSLETICHFEYEQVTNCHLKKSNSLSLCNTKKQHLSICIFLDKVLLLESPVSTSKRFENSPVSVRSKIRKSDSPASRRLPQLLLPTNSMFPGKCNSQSSYPTAGFKIRSKCYS